VRAFDSNVAEKIDSAQRWSKLTNLTLSMRRVKTVTDVNVMHGTPLPSISEYRPMPKLALDPLSQKIVLATQAISVVGSFADTIDDAGFTFLPNIDHLTLYWDGTNSSKRIVRRRADGFKETLPPGHLLINKLTQGQEGAPGPTYLMFPYYIPGTCNIGWVQGVVGNPAFCHLKDSLDARQQQRILGREPISDGPIRVQLLPVLPPPPPPDPTLPPPEPAPPPAPSPTQDPTTTPPSTPPPILPGDTNYCVMKGTEIVPIGDSPGG
jgi:hypothetical protein